MRLPTRSRSCFAPASSARRSLHGNTHPHLRGHTLTSIPSHLTFHSGPPACIRRPDVAPPEFLRELEKLQDQIPPFPSGQAYAVIQSELGVPASQVFSSLSPEAVAAASLGQVYRGVLRSTGEAVAVKVQRPGVATSIALDVYVLRQVGAGGWGGPREGWAVVVGGERSGVRISDGVRATREAP